VTGRYRLVDYTPEHLPEMSDLWVASWARTMADIDFEARRSWFVDHVAELRARGAAVVCAFTVSDGRMAGFITLDNSGLIDQLAVATVAWGRGAATVLLDDAKRRSTHLHLEVNQENPRAVRFYEREGFRRAGEGVNAASGRATWRYAWER
jgi:putative acetyltransferase